MARSVSDLLGRVQPGYELDLDALFGYSTANIPGFPLTASGFTLFQLEHGRSNLTFVMEVSEGASSKRYVLRKKLPGKFLEFAHAFEREFQILKGLGSGTDVPVPKVFCMCNDPRVIGTPFYIMEFLDGRIFHDPKLPEMAPERRRAICKAAVEALASLHSVDADAIGLGKYGASDHYCKQQIERLGKQCIASVGKGSSDGNPKMFALIDWLRQHIPTEDSASVTAGIVHGDFRLDNLVFHSVQDKVIGILDWELSTLGNQMCDVADIYSPYVLHIGVNESQLGRGLESIGMPEGIPSQGEYLAEYCSLSGKPWPYASWNFYVALSLFRGAPNYAGIYSRNLFGNAPGGESALHAGEKADAVVDMAWGYINRKSVLPEHPPSDSTSQNQSKLVGIENEKQGLLDIDIDIDIGGDLIQNKKVLRLMTKLLMFMEEHIYPMENEFHKLAHSPACWTFHPEEEKLKELAKKEGLWNLWMPSDSADRARKLIFDGSKNAPSVDAGNQLLGAGLSNLEYGYLCQIMGRSIWAPQVFNCGAPDTGNMEVLLRYGNKEQLHEWLLPMLEGKIQSSFAMIEPQGASSDATDVEYSIKREGDSYIINGKISGTMDPSCRLLIVMGKTNPTASKHRQQSMILVDMNTPGIYVKKPLTAFGFNDAPREHAEILFDNVGVHEKNIILGEGCGFEIAQGWLGPGRLRHCMRLIGTSERVLQTMALQALSRRTLGKLITEQGSFCSKIAKCRIELENTKSVVLEAADQLDKLGNKRAQGIIAISKAATPNMALHVLDMAIQVHGAAGLPSGAALAHLWGTARSLGLADGPDEVQLGGIAKVELEKAKL